MKTVKIKNITLKGFRGVKTQLDLSLGEKSVLFYGDNGTGKSSIADAIEWFYTDAVDHLSSEEIDKGVLRNFDLIDTDNASAQIQFSRTDLDNEKILSLKRGKLVASNSNGSMELQEYLKDSDKENLILRYRNLEDFIKGTKNEKLKDLSIIIGYGEVTTVKEVIKKSFNSVKTEIKSRGFESQIQSQGRVLFEKLGATIYTEKQLFENINKIIKPLNIDVTVISFADINSVIEKIKKPIDKKIINASTFLERCNNVLSVLKGEVSLINSEYEKFYSEFKDIFNDVESIKQTLFERVLTTGKEIISNKIYDQNNCPLCLHEQSKELLLQSIEQRLKVIEQSSDKLKKFEKIRDLIKSIIEERIKRIDPLLKEEIINESKYSSIKSILSSLKVKLTTIATEISTKVLAGQMVKDIKDIKLIDTDFDCEPSLDSQITELNKIQKNSNVDVVIKIELAKEAFISMQKLILEKQILEKQQKSIELIYTEFVKKQKEGLESFLTNFSSVINEYYKFMNPGELFEDLKIVPIEEDEELRGITVEFKFNGKTVSPPQKYFSESHINCYGLAFYLASVKAFNTINGFIILDDVISSFDTTHRQRFANLLFEKFSDYQIILLTHESEWFTYVRELAKKKSWFVHEIKFSVDDGTHLEQSPSDLKEQIIKQLKDKNEAQLGNTIRIYLEHLLKNICFQLEVKINFRFNDENEKRMPDELLNNLKATISKKSSDLKSKISIIERVGNSNILSNLLSHDNNFKAKIGDLSALWDDIIQLEDLFFCKECNKPVALKYFDPVTNKVRCSCAKISYDWKK